MAHRLDHPLHLMFPSFVNRDLKPRIALRLADLIHLRRRREAVFQLDASFKGFDLRIVEHTLDLDQIGFRNMVAGMEQRLGQVAVIREQHEPFAVEIQAADRKHAHGDSVQEVLHRGTSLRIIQRGHDVLGLVEDQIHIGLRSPKMFPIDFDMVASGIDFGAEFLYHATIDRHAPGRDQLLGFASRSQSGAGNEFL